ncbi:MAG: DUF5050 domain-containing protein [Clostridia bacterium]
MQIDLLCPVENQGVVVKTNSKTGEPYALFKLFNLSDRVVEAVAFMVRAYDAYGGELGEIRVDIGGLSGQPKDYFASAKAVSMAQFPEAKHITTEFLEVHFTEGDPYIKEGNLTEIKITEPDYDEKVRLMSAAGEDAVCYAKDEGPYWICVCGRPNVSGAENCVRCGREKAEVMSRYSSRDALTQTLAEMEEIQRQAEEEQRRMEEQARAERNKKRKKNVLIGAGAVVSLAVLCFIVYLAYGGVMTLLGSRAEKKGDFLTAYTRYAAAGNSSKLAAVSEEVRGNTSANLLQSGILAADEENLYYLDPSCAIYKENKTTGEKMRLSDAEGVFLNVSDGWVYYLDAATGQALHRISTDGAVKEVLFESKDAYFGNLALVGNELYFVLQEQRDDMTPEMQEQMAQQGGGNTYQYRLYRLRIGQKKPKLVSDQDIVQFVCYRDRIYYTDQTEKALYSMNRRGGDLKKLVSGPIYSFDVYQDALYYTDGTQDATTGQPKLSLSVAALDGTYKETPVADRMVLAFGFDGDELYYISYTNGAIQLCKKSGETDIVVTEGCQLFNLMDGYTLYVNGMGQFMKTTYDKSGFEEIQMAPQEPAEGAAETPENSGEAAPEATAE